MDNEEHQTEQWLEQFNDEEWARFDALAKKRAVSLREVAIKVRWLKWALSREAEIGVQEMVQSLSDDVDAWTHLDLSPESLPLPTPAALADGDEPAVVKTIPQ